MSCLSRADLDRRPDAFLAIASSTAVGRVHRIDAPAEQSIHGLAASPDGLAWLMVDNQPLEGEGPRGHAPRRP